MKNLQLLLLTALLGFLIQPSFATVHQQGQVYKDIKTVIKPKKKKKKRTTFLERIARRVFKKQIAKAEKRFANPKKEGMAGHRRGMAIASLILGIFGFVLGITVIPAIVLGAISIKQGDEVAERIGRAGLIIGCIWAAIGLLLLLLVLAIIAGLNNA